MRARARSIGAAISAIWMAGCASLLNGPTQQVEIHTDPPGATALILPGRSSVRTPATVALARRHVHTVLLELEGHCPEIAYLDRTVSPVIYLDAPFLLVSDLVGFRSSNRDRGAVFRLSPASVEVELRALDAGGVDACRRPPPGSLPDAADD